MGNLFKRLNEQMAINSIKREAENTVLTESVEREEIEKKVIFEKANRERIERLNFRK